MSTRIEWRASSCQHGATFFDNEKAARDHAKDLIDRGACHVEIEPQEVEEEASRAE